MANYAFTIDSTFSPFSMQEMLVPFSAYKEAFEKSEEQYDTLTQNADKFKYLSETLPEGSKARELYEGYANDLRRQTEDLAQNGLTMGNRKALTSLKRRYQGEIGRLSQADEAMREEKKLRQTLNAQDSSRLYATDNLSIDDFLDGNNPNLYSVSGNELYTRGAAAGKAASSRVFSAGDAGSTLNGYYRDYVQKMGYGADTIRKFYEDMSAIPELQMEADAILKEKGVYGNLTGVNLERARMSVINGMIDGAVYQETHAPQRDFGVPTWAEKKQQETAENSFNLQKGQLESQYMKYGYRLDKNGNPYRDEQLIKDLAEIKKGGSKGNSNSLEQESGYTTKNKKTLKLTWHGNNPKDTNGEADDDVTISELSEGDAIPGRTTNFESLPSYVQTKVKEAIGGGDVRLYRYAYQPFERGWFGSDEGNWSIFPDTEAEVAIIPTDIVKFETDPLLNWMVGK